MFSLIRVFGIIALVFLATTNFAQEGMPNFEYEPNDEHPYGRLNPDAPPETEQFAFMIGEHLCTDRLRNAEGEWVEQQKIWTGRYYLNGHAIRDDTWRSAASTSNIRAYDADSEEWVVTFFSAPGAGSAAEWRGNQEADAMVVRQPQTAPNGTEGVSRLTFSDISDEGFEWKGEFVAAEGTDQEFVFEFWSSSCKKTE